MACGHRSTLRRRAAMVPLAVAVAIVVASCGEQPEDAAPQIPEVDFTPTMVLELDGASVEAVAGAGERSPVSLDPPTVTGGSVIEVVNVGDDGARLRGGDAFDTGELLPGERTVVVLVNDGPGDERLALDPEPGVESTVVEGPTELVVVPTRPT